MNLITMQELYVLYNVFTGSAPYRLKDVPKIPVVFWNFSEAPQSLKDLSENRGDEKYLLLLPRFQLHQLPPWVEVMCAHGDFHDYSFFDFPDFVVRIIYHG